MKSFFKKLLIVSLLVTAGTGALLVATPAYAQTSGGCTGGTCTYVPLEPLPGVSSTGLDFAKYVSGMFRLMITLGALFAVLMLVIAGIGYMMSEGGVSTQKAKDRATSALYGLLLLTACWLILYTINPNLLRFDIFTSTLNTTAGRNTSPTGDPVSGPTIYAAPRPEGTVGNGLFIMSPSSAEKVQQIKDFSDACWKNSGGEIRNVDSGSGATTFFCVK